ncbi:MAG: glycoside hydrolase family 16 protein [Actinomycetes bacterium]
MTDPTGAHRVVDPVTKAGYELVFQETFDGDTLDRARWLPHYLPQSSSREASAARYRLGDGTLRLVIEAERSAEICICEIFGRNVTAGRAGVGMGLHPFRDPRIRDESSVEDLAIDARDLHTYAAEWTPEHGAFFVDHRLVKLVSQSPAYPMQFMLGVYEFPDGGEAGRPAPARPYPKEFVVDSFRAYRSVAR